MGIVEKSKALYGPFLPDADRAIVEALDEGDQAYFWTLLYYELRTELEKSWFSDMERKISKTIEKVDAAPLPFKAAEESVSTHGWFRRVL